MQENLALKADFERRMRECVTKMERARLLIEMFGDEEERY